MNDEEPTTTIEEALEAVLCDCLSCRSIALTVLELEIPMPIGGWAELLARENIRVSPDAIGRPSIPVLAARKVIATQRRREELEAESAARLFAKLDARRPAMAGFPPVEGMTALESLATLPGYQTVADEFPGRQRPDFLREELAAGQHADDEKRRLAVERKKQRLVDQMKDDLR